jgi:hypothetical protein
MVSTARTAPLLVSESPLLAPEAIPLAPMETASASGKPLPGLESLRPMTRPVTKPELATDWPAKAGPPRMPWPIETCTISPNVFRSESSSVPLPLASLWIMPVLLLLPPRR